MKLLAQVKQINNVFLFFECSDVQITEFVVCHLTRMHSASHDTEHLTEVRKLNDLILSNHI